jgi:tape measure domain-containing protein
MANAMKLTLHLSAVDNMSRVVSGAMRNSQRAIQEAQARSLRVQQEARQNMLDAGMMMVGGAAALAYPLKMAANYERLRVQMNILTGSVAEGGRTFDSLLRLAKDTPLSLTEVAKAQTMMMGYGQSATAAASAIKMLGDVTSVTQGDLTGAIVAYGQAAQEGKMLTRDVRQFINAGVPAVSILQNMLGKDKNIFKMAEEGKITFDLLQEAMTRATSKGGMFADGLKIQANTLQGTWVKFTDVLDRTAAVFGESLVPAAKSLMTTLMPLLEATIDFVKENKTLAKALLGSVAAFTIVTGATFAYNGLVWAATFAMRGWAGSILMAIWRLTGLGAITKALSFQLFRLRFAIFTNATMTALWGRVTSFQLVPALIAAAKGIWGFIGTLRILSTTILSVPILGWILAVVAGIVAIGVALYKNWDAVTGFFVKLWTGFKEFLPKAKAWGADLIASIKDGIVNAAPTLFAAVGKVVEFTRGFFPASPAKHGAFKDIHRIKIIEQVAKTVKAGPLTNAIGRVTDTAMGAMGSGSSPMPAFAPVGGGASVSVNYSPTINFGGGASETERMSLLEQLNAHKDEVARLVKDAMKSNERKRF